jgi:organic radical activating enzyme
MDVKVTSTRDPRYFYVNWWLTDHCNWDCSYCHDEIKRGRLPFPDIRDIRDFLDQAHSHAAKFSRTLSIDLTGGEVTEYPHLQELLAHARGLGSVLKLRTNASQSLDDFAAMIENLDLVTIEFHPEHTQTSHFMLCLNRAGQLEDLRVSVNLNALPQRWSEIEQLEAKIRLKWPKFTVTVKMLFEDPVRNTQPMEYLPHQQKKLKKQSGSLVIQTDDGIEYSDYQTMVLENRNNFQEWQCNIGLEQIIVDAWGIVRRGHCRQGGTSIGQIGKSIRFDDLAVTCKKPVCVNSFDIQATKVRFF